MKRPRICIPFVLVLAILIGVAAFWKETAGAQEKGQQKAAAPLIKWEYKILKQNEDSEKELNSLGQDGWELVATTSSVRPSDFNIKTQISVVTFVLKRPKQ